MRARGLLAVVLLVVWVLWGPLAAVLASCEAMAVPCEAPCGLGGVAVEALPSTTAALPVTALEPQAGRRAPTVAARGRDPVPKLLRLPA